MNNIVINKARLFLAFLAAILGCFLFWGGGDDKLTDEVTKIKAGVCVEVVPANYRCPAISFSNLPKPPQNNVTQMSLCIEAIIYNKMDVISSTNPSQSVIQVQYFRCPAEPQNWAEWNPTLKEWMWRIGTPPVNTCPPYIETVINGNEKCPPDIKK